MGPWAYQIGSGCFRVVCTNGLIVSVGSFPSIRVAHRGDIVEEIVASALDISERFGALAGRVERMEQRLLLKDEQIKFAARALAVRFPEPNESGIQPAQLLTCHRVDDLGNDLWSVLNKVQENLLRGGLVRLAASGRRSRTRRITSIRELLASRHYSRNRDHVIMPRSHRQLATPREFSGISFTLFVPTVQQ